MPYAFGKFVAIANGTRIDVRITLHPAILAFCVPLFAGIAYLIWSTLLSPSTTQVLVTLFVILFVYVPVFSTFEPESKKAQEFINEVFGKYRTG